MKQAARLTGPGMPDIARLGPPWHLSFFGTNDAHRPEQDSEAADRTLVDAVMRDLEAFASGHRMNATRREAGAPKPTPTLELERPSAASRHVSQKQATSDAERGAAHSAGRYVGRLAGGLAGMCPHPHRQLDLRLAWMDGFSKGRAELKPRAPRDGRPA